ncbi:hypothetical protein PFAG_00140 [Plasmodium falciparum Santa Lucia]|uniref:Uncharacterized protein n=3 Tax=Plasmodium falciparum TaxID=5833 RepID=A0A0L7KLA5_PLAFX|nr:hypothetical protein PFFVO_00139 [Plasmodium falciparum Vietnam Oak-Knoll (FVO)]EUT93830.1 hypothetical protein PFAG_00140 [Plasmodium falciparum Santa Lucia]KOB63915.1 hypothetical protein PFHG_05201 [Plasmodium falciparum HB3]
MNIKAKQEKKKKRENNISSVIIMQIEGTSSVIILICEYISSYSLNILFFIWFVLLYELFFDNLSKPEQSITNKSCTYSFFFISPCISYFWNDFLFGGFIFCDIVKILLFLSCPLQCVL